MKRFQPSYKKWLVRAGALLILLGFVLPSLTVSCTALPAPQQSISLFELATLADFGAPLLFLLPLGALVTIAFSLLSTGPSLKAPLIFFGQAAGAVLGVLGIVLTLLLYYADAGKYGFDIEPEIGVNVLATGYALIAVGLVFQLPDLEAGEQVYEKEPQEIQITQRYGGAPGEPLAPYQEAPYDAAAFSPYTPPGQAPPAPVHAAPLTAPPPQAETIVSPAWLELLRGDLPQRSISLDCDHFTIGRGSRSNLQLSDRSVSRQHARLRFANGVWFIQDQGSAVGVFVNGQRVNATRLKPGDIIEIGGYQFEFRGQ